MAAQLTSIIVPTVFNPEAVARVTALIRETTPEEHELIVVDTTPESLGYVKTANRGLAQALGDVLVVMNDDCQPQSGWLPPLLHAVLDEGIALCSPYWRFARLGGHCLVFPRRTYELTGGFDERYRHWCADHHMELTLIDAGEPIRQVPESNVVHDTADPLRIHNRKSNFLGNHADLPNTGAWYNEDQEIYEAIWPGRFHHQHWPEDWSETA